MRFDWTDLRLFLHACDGGSMTAAAQRAHLTLAAVSARLRALEQDAGVPLLRRHARGVVPTAAGEALARHARVVCHQLDALRRDIGAGAPPAPGQTILLANSSVSARPLHRVVGDVLARHAGARLVLRESGSEVTVHALHTGAADVGIVSDAAATEGLVVRELGADPLVLIAPAGHPLALSAALRFSDAFAHDWVAWREDGALHTHLAMQALRAGGALRIAVGVPTAAGVVDLVARGFGISVLPRALLDCTAPAAPLAVRELREPWALRRLLVCRRPDAANPVALELFDAFGAQWAGLDQPPCRATCAAAAPAAHPAS
ncbi:MAG: LysR family transcriptional regulator [Pseudomonadota bacterium]